MGRLVDEHAAAFGIPAAAPGVGEVVGRVAPAIHGERAQDRPADLAGVDRVFHAADGLVPSPLADHAELGFVQAGRREHGVAIGQAGGQRLFDESVHAGLGSRDRRAGVKRMGRGDAETSTRLFREHPGHIVVGPSLIARSRTMQLARSRRRRRRRIQIRQGWPGPGRGSGRLCRSPPGPCAPGPSAGLNPESTSRPCASGRPATRPFRPCRSCHPRC